MAVLQLKCVLLSLLLAKARGLSTGTTDFSCQFLVNYTQYVARQSDLETIVVIKDEGVRNCDLERILEEELQLPLITSNALNTHPLYQVFGHNSLAIVLQKHINDPIRHTADFVLEERHDIPILFGISMPPSSRELREFFVWCWQINAIDVLLVYNTAESHDVFTYTPFPTLQIFNRTLAAFSDFKWGKKLNLQRYQFRVVLFTDAPMVFAPPNTTDRIWGMAGRLFKQFVLRLNATYSVRVELDWNKIEKSREREIILMPSNNEMDIGVNTFTSVIEFANETEISYPITMTKVCIIVPFVREMPKHRYILHVFALRSWVALAATLLAFVCVQLFLNLTHRQFHSMQLGLAIIWAFNTLLSQPTSAIALPSKTYRVLLVLFAMFGILATTIYIGSLSSLISAPPPGKQLRSAQDLLNSNIKILLTPYDRFVYFDSGLLPPALAPLLLESSALNVVTHRVRLNTSYAYVANTQKWCTLNYQQEYLQKPRFRIASEELCSPMMPLSLALQRDSIFDEPLKQLTMEVQQFGFMEKWIDDSNMKFRRNKKIFMLRENIEPHRPLSIAHLYCLFELYGICIAICLASFVGEHLTRRFQQRRTQRKARRLMGRTEQKINRYPRLAAPIYSRPPSPHTIRISLK